MIVLIHKMTKDVLHFAKLKLSLRQSSSTWRRPILLIYLASLLICATMLLTPSVFGIFVPQPAITPKKQIVTNTLQLHELWRWTPNGEILHQFMTNEGWLILGVSGDWGSKIVVFNAQTGHQLWSQPFSGNLRSLTADSQRVYVSEIRYVQAYDLATGQKLWQGAKQSSGKKGGLYVYAREDHLEVYDYDLSKEPNYKDVFILDPQSGETVDTIEYPLVFFIKGNIVYSRVRNGFVAEDIATGKTLWKLDHDWYAQRWPVIIDQMMYLDVRDSAGSIYAVNPETGEVYWHSKGVKSDNPDGEFTTKVAYGADFIYVLKKNGGIAALNYQTGEKVGSLEIEPPSVYSIEGRVVDFTYDQIAASSEFVAVYYADSHEIIVLKRGD